MSVVNRSLYPLLRQSHRCFSNASDKNGAILNVGNFAKIDLNRDVRAGFPEVIFGSGKEARHLCEIMQSMHNKLKDKQRVIATRVSAEQYALLQETMGNDVQYRHDIRIAYTTSTSTPTIVPGKVAVLCAGSSDYNIAEEAATLLELSHVQHVIRLYDVGVAGLNRLLMHLPEIESADVVIVCAGMDGALPSVVGGLVKAPVIAVPTSVGYGASFGGMSALLTMLNSCSPGVSVVNIDNGFGAAVSAYKILKTNPTIHNN